MWKQEGSWGAPSAQVQVSSPSTVCCKIVRSEFFYSAFWGLTGYHISSNQYETTIFGPKIIRIGALLAEIPPFHCMARISHWWGVWPFAGTGCACEGSGLQESPTNRMSEDSLWNIDANKPIDRTLKLNFLRRYGQYSPATSRIAGILPLSGNNTKTTNIEVFWLTSYEPIFVAIILRNFDD